MGVVQTGKTRPIWNYAGVVEVAIDRPAKDVWPYFFANKRDIWSKTEYTTTAGEPGEVGEIYAMKYKRGQFFFEAIKVKPMKELVLKIAYKDDEEDEPHLSGYDYITLCESGGRTTVILHQAFAVPIEPESNPERESETQEKFLADIFQNLKRMVEEIGH